MTDDELDEHMSSHCGLFWNRADVKVRKFSATVGAKSSILRIELEVLHPHRLADLIRDLQEAQRPAKPRVPRRTPDRPGLSRDERPALPAPLLQLTDGRSR